MLEGALILWFTLTFLSLIYLCFALLYRTPGPWVMKVAWFLVVLYTGPIGLFIYLLACHEPLHGTHEKYTDFRWKQAVGSEVHCLAGDATGIIIAAMLLSFISISSGAEMFIEYIAGFVSGLFIFQALFMKHMMGGSYWKALIGTFMPEWLSMNMIMAGMIPVMFIWRYYDPSAADPSTLNFWGSMSLATIVGGILAYPINDWLVNNGLKHGMVTIRKADDPHGKIVVTTGGCVEETGEHKQHGSHEQHGAHQQEQPNKHGQTTITKIILMTVFTLVILAIGVAISLIWAS